MRRLSSILLLLLLAAGVWFGARAFTHRGEIKATIIFPGKTSLRRGDPVVADGGTVGRVVSVDPVDARSAVTVRLAQDHRRAILSDSLFAVEGRSLVVTNAFAVGAPVDDGTILEAKEDRVGRWMAKHGGALAGVLGKVRVEADRFIDDDFRALSASVPRWKAEGTASLESHLAAARREVDAAAAELQKHNRAEEARKLKEKFDRWLAEVRR